MPQKKAPKIDPKWIYKETSIAKYLAIPKKLMESVRKRDRMTFPPSLYLSKKGYPIMYDQPGFDLMCKIFGLIPIDCKELYESEKVREEKEQGVKWGIVFFVPWNRREQVQVQLAEDDSILTVTVGCKGSEANSNFINGMPIPIKSIKNDVGMLACKRPRRKGVW